MNFNATFFVSIISFLVFTFIMNVIFYKPLERIINKREKLVIDTLNDAEKMKSESENLQKIRDEKLTNATIEGRKIVAKSIQNANEKSVINLKQAKEISAEKITETKQELLKQSQSAQDELDKELNKFAEQISEKVLG